MVSVHGAAPQHDGSELAAMRKPTLLSRVLAYSFLAGAAGATLAIAWTFVRAFGRLSPSIQAALIAGCTTVIVSVMSLILNANYQKSREIGSEHSKQKAEIYEEFMKMIFDMLLREQLKKEQPAHEEFARFFAGFNQRMIVWASDEVLAAYLYCRGLFEHVHTAEPLLILRATENLFYAFRRDLGHRNAKLRQDDLLRVFIRDLDAHIREQSTAQVTLSQRNHGAPGS